jgi:predicted lipoprotein with Yx(FWY)xxD motif
MENSMTQLLTSVRSALGVVVVAAIAAVILVATAQATVSSTSHVRTTGALVVLKKTALGSILVDSRGRTLYLFEKDRNGVSACNTACASYWPPLTSGGNPRAGNGVRRSLLGLNRAHQVTYAGHPLYTFVGDTRPGQTAGEGLNDFGGGWDALAASGQKIEPHTQPTGGGYSGGY